MPYTPAILRMLPRATAASISSTTAPFLQRALAISPVNLPLRPGVAVSPHPDLFQGLRGIFNDSLADGWGWLLFDRAMRARIVARPVRDSRPSRPCRC